MDTNDNLSSETLADEAHVDSADGGETVANTDTLSLADLNKIFGTTFKDKDAALQAIKDTKSYVGKKKEDVAAELAQSASSASTSNDPELKAQVQSLQNDLFFTANPQFKEHRALIESLGNPAEVVERPEIKTLLEKAKVADEVEQKKSVVHSSPRLAQTTGAIEQAIKVANATGSKEMTADVLAQAIRQEIEG